MEKEIIDSTEPTNVTKLYKNQIKFKAIQFFGNRNADIPPLNVVFGKLKAMPQANIDHKLLMARKRIREAYLADGKLVDECIKDIQAKYTNYIAGGKTPEEAMASVNAEINKYLLDTDIDLPFEQLKMSDFQPLESLAELDALEGIVEIDVEG